MSILLLVIGIILFIGLVVIHEFGHFMAARRSGVKVEEFGIFFPPRVWSKKMKGGYIFSINALPLGGFVKLKGEHDADTAKGSFGAAKLSNKVKIMLAGVAMNFLAAYVLFTLLAVIGLPRAPLQDLPFYNREQFSIKSDTKIIKRRVVIGVLPGSPADKAGLKDNDELISIGDSPVRTSEELPQLTEKYAGQTVPITVRRGKTQHQFTTSLNKDRREDKGYLGVQSYEAQVLRSTWSAPIVGAGLVIQFSEVSLKGLGYALGELVKGNTSAAQETVGGPVGVVKVLADSTSIGISTMLFIIALISVSLALINVLPIPALDGGRLFVTLLFRTLRKPLNKRTEEWIHGTGFALPMLLFVLLTVVDVKRIF